MPSPTVTETLVNPSYHLSLVALSYLIALAGSFIALHTARHIVRPNGRIHLGRSLVSGVALGGIGVWSMHFIGMLALDLQMGTAYSMLETLLSFVAAVLASAAALAYVAKAPEKMSRIIGAGIMLGLGVAVMHYLGMYGMRFGGFIQWSVPLVMGSIVIAIVAAIAALWLAFNIRSMLSSIAAAAIMAVAVCAMHYTGMQAADFICTTATPQAIPGGLGIISSLSMPTWMLMLSTAAAFLIGLDHLLRVAGTAPKTAI